MLLFCSAQPEDYDSSLYTGMKQRPIMNADSASLLDNINTKINGTRMNTITKTGTIDEVMYLF